MQELLKNTQAKEVQGGVNVVHQFINMPEETAVYTFPNGTTIDVSFLRHNAQ